MLRCKKIHTAFPSQDCCQNCAFLFLQTWTIPLLVCCLAREDTWKALEAQLGQWKGGPAEHLSSQSRLICCGTTKGNGHCFSKPTSTDPLQVSNFLPTTKEDRGPPMQKWQLSFCSHLKCRPFNGLLYKLKVLECLRPSVRSFACPRQKSKSLLKPYKSSREHARPLGDVLPYQIVCFF